MKNKDVPGKWLSILVIGLMLTTVAPAAMRHIHLPDFINGFVVGIGLVLELTAVVNIIRFKKANTQN